MLLIDCGNSAIKCRLVDQEKFSDCTFSIFQDSNLAKFKQYLESISTGKVVLASVAPENVESSVITCLLQQFPQIKIQKLTSLPELNGLKNSYYDFRQMGVDRWLSLVAANELFDESCLIVDAGTAIKIELLSKKNGYLGGAIMPGFNTSKQRFKRIFPSISFSQKDHGILSRPGRSTYECLYLPDEPLTPNLLIALIETWRDLIESPSIVVLTGQDACIIEKELSAKCQFIPDLVFKGMLKQIQLQG